jgi:hypothetical protein
MSNRIGRTYQQKALHRMSDGSARLGGMVLGERSYVGQQAVRLAVQQSPSPPSPHRLGLLGDWMRVPGLGFHHIGRKHKPDIESGEP